MDDQDASIATAFWLEHVSLKITNACHQSTRCSTLQMKACAFGQSVVVGRTMTRKAWSAKKTK